VAEVGVVTIRPGGTVTWTNATGVLHNVTFTTGGTDAPPGVADATAGTATRTFVAAGTFAYHCSNHAGMQGTVTVVP
jgi:plastocyanin